MADLLTSQRDSSNGGKLLVIGLILVAAAAAAFALFYRHENHPPVEGSITRVLTLPVQTKHGSMATSAGEVAAPDQTEDVLYVVTVVQLRDHSENPLFLKDIAGSVTLQDGRENPGRLIGPRDRARLLQLVPGIAPLLQQAHFPPMDPEQKVEAHATWDGYATFLYSMPAAEWTNRQSATVRIDFYHQDSLTLAVPK